MRYASSLIAVFVLLGVAPAGFAECEEKLFRSKTGSLYLEAETALFTDENAVLALEALAKLKELKLNCYEYKHAVQLSAASHFRLEQYLEAAKDLEEALEKGLLEDADRLKTYYQVAQIYLQEEMLKKAKYYLDQWLNAGAKPNVSQYMQLAALHNKLEDNNAAARFLEALLRIEPKPEKNVLDFVIFIYNETKQKKKLADFLRKSVIPRFPVEKRYWEVMASLYFESNEERSAFETVKAMYLAGLLSSEGEIMRVVNFYNRFNAPYEAGQVLEQEIKKGRVKKTAKRLDLLANLYQVSREYDRAIPVLRNLARLSKSGKAYERLGRSYFELGRYDKAVEALTIASKKPAQSTAGQPGQLWGLIGRASHQLDRREEARNAFIKAGEFKDGETTSEAWLIFMDNEDATTYALKVYNAQVARDELSNIKKGCDRMTLLGEAGGALPDECKEIGTRLDDLDAQLVALKKSPPPTR